MPETFDTCPDICYQRDATDLGEITHCFIRRGVGYLSRQNNQWILIDVNQESRFF
jgi:hypothetical protein